MTDLELFKEYIKRYRAKFEYLIREDGTEQLFYCTTFHRCSKCKIKKECDDLHPTTDPFLEGDDIITVKLMFPEEFI